MNDSYKSGLAAMIAYGKAVAYYDACMDAREKGRDDEAKEWELKSDEQWNEFYRLNSLI